MSAIRSRSDETGQSNFELDVSDLGKVFEVRTYRQSDNIFGALFLDIIERKKAEAGAEASDADLMRVSRLSAMGAMASTLAHELDQPLATSANYLALVQSKLKQGDGDPVTLLPAIGAALEACLRAGQIIRNIRSFTVDGSVTTGDMTSSQS